MGDPRETGFAIEFSLHRGMKRFFRPMAGCVSVSAG